MIALLPYISIFSFFLGVMCLIAIIQYKLKRNTRKQNKLHEEFIQKEHQSLVVRKKEFLPEDFIKPTISILKFKAPQNLNPIELNEFNDLVTEVKELSTYDMMNFKELTNTELRLRFGTANQNIITTNELNFNNFLKFLGEYGFFMYEHNDLVESITAYNLAITLGSDYSSHFISLAKIYLHLGNVSGYDELLKKASCLEGFSKKTISNKLKALRD